MTESPIIDSGFVVPVFSLRDDLIACLNKSMAFLTVVASSRLPSTTNQLKTSLNPRNQATIQYGRVTVQQVQGRQGQSYSDEEQLVFLVDPGVLDGQAVQTIIPNIATFQTEDLDTYDSDYDDILNEKAVLMANISNYGSDIISELQNKDSTICKLKDIIKSLRENFKEDNVNYDYEEIETKNVELENSVAKLSCENERLCNEINHVKQVFKEQIDSVKKIRIRTKDHSDSLIDKLNLKSG
uniref:Uncharacterized protein n=1 Tax=Tanacetum cinerariifolium TaxID=118510 RepID=A0A6L2JYU9_TANCI|nr:hypothetical protein [Tanacetum cinerariifolium]